MNNPPKKFDNRSFAAKPIAIPPTPPKAKTPEILSPKVCKINKIAAIPVDILASFEIASMVVGS